MEEEQKYAGEQQKRKLIDLWGQIQELVVAEPGAYFDVDLDVKFRSLKEHWFADAYEFLQKLPEKEHCWCDNGDIMFPILEPFSDLPCNPFSDAPLRLLWRGRLSFELSLCTSCVVKHHQAQGVYKEEYLDHLVEPLLVVLQELDVERVTCQIWGLLNIIKKIVQPLLVIVVKILDAELDLAYQLILLLNELNEREQDYGRNFHMAISTVIFEVLMFPYLLEHPILAETFGDFLSTVQQTYDIDLVKNHKYQEVQVTLTLLQSAGKPRVSEVPFMSPTHLLETFRRIVDELHVQLPNELPSETELQEVRYSETGDCSSLNNLLLALEEDFLIASTESQVQGPTLDEDNLEEGEIYVGK